MKSTQANRVTHLGATNTSLTYLIVQHLSTVGYPVGPYEIASSLGLNPSSVRSRLSKMLSKGQVSKPHYGKYQLTPTYGLGLSRGVPRFQNVLVVCEGVVGVVSDRVVLVDDDLCRVSVVFGGKRGRVSYRVGAPCGIDMVGLSVIHGMVEGEARGRGLVLGDWIVKNIEQLEDYSGFRLEGLEAVTYDNLHGEMVKYYNKPGIRREARSSQPIPLHAFRRVFEEGLDVATVHRRLNALEHKFVSLEASMKGGIRIVFGAVVKVLDELRNISGSVSS